MHAYIHTYNSHSFSLSLARLHFLSRALSLRYCVSASLAQQAIWTKLKHAILLTKPLSQVLFLGVSSAAGHLN